MHVTFTQEDRRLVALISGELDHHGAKSVMNDLERHIDAAMPRELILDLAGLTFTDSSGIAVLLHTWRHMGRVGGTMRVIHTPAQAGKVFRAAQLQRLISFESQEDIT